jgi:hypothetical protein
MLCRGLGGDPFLEAKAWQKRLRAMRENRRNADRHVLLGD